VLDIVQAISMAPGLSQVLIYIAPAVLDVDALRIHFYLFAVTVAEPLTWQVYGANLKVPEKSLLVVDFPLARSVSR
jgi:hypothetical protein